MAFSYPVGINTEWQKVRYIFRLKEYLRLLHNYAGFWYREGLTQDQYDNGIDAGDLQGTPGQTFVLTSQLKSKYPYQPNITKTAVKNFIAVEWEPRFNTVEDEIHGKTAIIEADASNDHLLDINF